MSDVAISLACKPADEIPSSISTPFVLYANYFVPMNRNLYLSNTPFGPPSKSQISPLTAAALLMSKAINALFAQSFCRRLSISIKAVAPHEGHDHAPVSHPCARNGVIAHYFEAEMSVYLYILFRMGFKIRRSSALRTVFQHGSEKFTCQMLPLSFWSYDEIVQIPFAVAGGF